MTHKSFFIILHIKHTQNTKTLCNRRVKYKVGPSWSSLKSIEMLKHLKAQEENFCCRVMRRYECHKGHNKAARNLKDSFLNFLRGRSGRLVPFSTWKKGKRFHTENFHVPSSYSGFSTRLSSLSLIISLLSLTDREIIFWRVNWLVLSHRAINR